jgi:hypothetical protein
MELRKEVKSGTSVYNGIFNLLVLAGARDWISGNVPQSGELDAHHIVPASWGAKHVEGNLIHSILNRTPLTDDTNRNFINDKLPNEYLPKLIASSSRQEVEKLMEAHFISPAALSILLREKFTARDFEEFIAERQKTLLDAIETLLIKERMDLPPKLRDLDAAIEATELGLRRIVGSRLSDEAAALPAHVSQKVSERIAKALRKNAALDADLYKTLPGQLEYFDLREVQDTIMAGSLWPKFEPLFKNKETLTGKFGQLAELRNSIRHSRSIDEVVRKEGEAAIAWFGKVLEKAA